MDDSKLIIDTPAIIELFGHTKMAGHITSIVVGSSAFLRVEVPKTKKQEAFTRLLNPSAVYAINPCTEEVMKAMADSFNFTPLSPWDLPASLKKPALPEPDQDDSSAPWNQRKTDDEE